MASSNTKFYTEEELQKVQQTELSIFKDFKKICKDNSLTYFGLAGTGIGALRHGGFIPWDDDIDVGLLRKDYGYESSLLRQVSLCRCYLLY